MGMRLGIILSILAVPICAQATLCEQFMTLSDHIRAARKNAEREWDARPILRKIGDALAAVKKPEAVLELKNEELTKELASHFDGRVSLEGGRIRLIRYANKERNAYEAINHFEYLSLDRLLETEYVLHLTASADHPAYMWGSIKRLFDGGFDFIDFKSRILYRIEADEFVSAKMLDLGSLPEDHGRRLKGEPNFIWEQTSDVSLIDVLKSKMDSAARLILQVKDGSSYGINGFHKVLVRHLGKLQFNDKGIFIPELNILVPSQDVLAVSAP
jgi:hypothetical protein